MNRQLTGDKTSRNNTLEETSDSDFVNDSITSTPHMSYHYKISSRDTSIDHMVSSRNTSNSHMESSRNFSSGHMASSHNDTVNSSRHVTSQYHDPIKSNSCFLKKHVWCGVIVGSVLSILIAVPVVYFVTKSNYETYNSVNVNALSLQFDQSTLYNNRFLSEDSLTLSSTLSKATPVSSMINPNTLNEYQGVIGNKCFDSNSKIYFEVKFEFSVISSFEPLHLIFEVGLAERDRVDNHLYVGGKQTNGWSFLLYVCNTTDKNACLTAQHSNVYLFDSIPSDSLVLGSKYSGKFGFIVNTKQYKFSVVRFIGGDISYFHTVQNVYSAQRLCPVFGVYNPKLFEVQLKLSKTYDISKTVWNFVAI